VVAIVVTVVTEGAASSAIAEALGTSLEAGGAAATTATVAGAAVGAAAGSIVSQGVAIAIGQQSGFSFSEVAVAALTAGLTEGAPTEGIPGELVQDAVNNVVTQGVNVALGVQNGFNWQAVAISALAFTAGAQAKGELSGVLNGVGYSPDAKTHIETLIVAIMRPCLAHYCIRSTLSHTWADGITNTCLASAGT
jgi:hypothetical protein